MKRSIAVILILSLIFTFSTVAADAYTKPYQPKVITKNVDDSYIKVSWNKCKYAKKYEVYRSTSKTGTYKRIKTTTSRTFYDKTVKNNKYYYYKVRSVNGTAKSKFSTIKRNRITFNGRLEIENPIVGLQKYGTGVSYVKAYGCKDDIVATYDDNIFDLNWGDQLSNGSYPIYYCLKEFDGTDANIEISFENHERLYKEQISIWFDKTDTVRDYKDTFVTDFGSFFACPLSYIDIYDNEIVYYYEADDIPYRNYDIISDYERQLKRDWFTKIKTGYINSSYQSQWTSETFGVDVTFIAPQTKNGVFAVIISQE